MKNAGRKLAALVLIAVMLLSAAVPVSAASASIKLNASKKTLAVGGTVKLKATVTGKSKTVTWKSSNKSVATVSKSGKVTAKKAGKATITAKANGKTAKCVVTVQKSTAYTGRYRVTWKANVSFVVYYQPAYTVTINKVTANSVILQVERYGVNGSPLYQTNIITAKRSGNYASFKWKDTWGNSGTGKIYLNKSYVKLKMTKTKSSAVNRSSLATSGYMKLKRYSNETEVYNNLD